VVVHGELELLPAATKAEAVKAVEQFTSAYNKADAAYDSSLDADYTTGALGIIDAARLKAGRVNNPDGNPQHTPLVLSDVKYTIVEKAGWPRWFVADAKGNKGGDARWLMVFSRGERAEPWQATYLTLVAPGSVPEFKRAGKDGHAEAVPADSAEPAERQGCLRGRRVHEYAALDPGEERHQAGSGHPVHRRAADRRRLRAAGAAHRGRRGAGLLHHAPLHEADGRGGRRRAHAEQERGRADDR
jgi:hypothetical protein